MTKEMLLQTTASRSLDSIYPIGSIYMSMNAADPSELFGGSWIPLNEGRVLIGCNSTYPAGSTGGEFEHTLTVDEMPAHTHSNSFNIKSSQPYHFNYDAVYTGRGLSSANSGSTGGSQPHNNMQPYLAVYMWYRNA